MFFSAINDPKLLEVSGIGRSDVLREIGVEQKIDLPGVGENVQEHNFIKVSFELADKHVTLDLMKDGEYAAKAVQDQYVRFYYLLNISHNSV